MKRTSMPWIIAIVGAAWITVALMADNALQIYRLPCAPLSITVPTEWEVTALVGQAPSSSKNCSICFRSKKLAKVCKDPCVLSISVKDTQYEGALNDAGFIKDESGSWLFEGGRGGWHKAVQIGRYHGMKGSSNYYEFIPDDEREEGVSDRYMTQKTVYVLTLDGKQVITIEGGEGIEISDADIHDMSHPS